MKLSLKLEYSCRVLAQLSRTYGQNQLAHIEELAQAEGIPANYLVQILNELRNAGLINSRRGKLGGYALARAPQEISVLDIVRAMEGELLELNAPRRGDSGEAVANVWREIGQMIREKLDSTPLTSMAPAINGEMYHI